jgi:hypothetical protein
LPLSRQNFAKSSRDVIAVEGRPASVSARTAPETLGSGGDASRRGRLDCKATGAGPADTIKYVPVLFTNHGAGSTLDGQPFDMTGGRIQLRENDRKFGRKLYFKCLAAAEPQDVVFLSGRRRSSEKIPNFAVQFRNKVAYRAIQPRYTA